MTNMEITYDTPYRAELRTKYRKLKLLAAYDVLSDMVMDTLTILVCSSAMIYFAAHILVFITTRP